MPRVIYPDLEFDGGRICYSRCSLIGFYGGISIYFLWYRNRLFWVWSSTVTRASRHSFCIVHVLAFKILRTWGGVWRINPTFMRRDTLHVLISRLDYFLYCNWFYSGTSTFFTFSSSICSFSLFQERMTKVP